MPGLRALVELRQAWPLSFTADGAVERAVAFLDEVLALAPIPCTWRGALAEWLGTGLQNPVRRFDSGRRLC